MYENKDLLLRAMAALAALPLLASCLGGHDDLPLGSACESDVECVGTLICRYGLCRSPCQYDRDCPEGQGCVAVTNVPDLRVCTFGDEGVAGVSDCPEPLVRGDDGVCREPCEPGCEDGRTCIDGVCVEPDGTPDADIDAETFLDADIDVPPDDADIDMLGDVDAEALLDAEFVDSLDAEAPPIVDISAAYWSSCALLEGGDVRCWGYGGAGQLGYGNTNNIGDDELPSSVGPVSVGEPVTEIESGNYHTCALLESRALRCWGRNDVGQLGYGDTNTIGDDELPSSVAADVSLGEPAVQVSAGNTHTCAVLENGDLRCWGGGSSGRLGYGNLNSVGDDELPSSVDPVSVGGPVAQVAAGSLHTCAVLRNGELRCWGYGYLGRLGYGNEIDIGDDELPESVGPVAVGDTAVQVTAGYNHTCALLAGGNVRCWGDAEYGQLGYGNNRTFGDNELPTAAGPVSLGGAALQIAAGDYHTCAVLEGGDLRCWGRGGTPQLGYDTLASIGDDEVPTDVDPVSVGGPVVQAAAGQYHTCALLESGDMRCWGHNRYGQLGYGNTNAIGDDELPSDVEVVPCR